jgi:hypothetical protein
MLESGRTLELVIEQLRLLLLPCWVELSNELVELVVDVDACVDGDVSAVAAVVLEVDDDELVLVVVAEPSKVLSDMVGLLTLDVIE